MINSFCLHNRSFSSVKSGEKDSALWLVSFALLLLLVGRNVFNKPVLAIFLIVYLPLVIIKFAYLFRVFSNSISLVCFFVFFVLSYLWTVTPLVTIDIIFVQLSFVLFALFISVASPVSGFSRALRVSSIALLILLVAFVAVFPGASFSSAGLVAFYVQKNNLGAMAAVCCLTLLFAPGRRWFHWLFLCIAFVILLASRSKTSIALVGLCVLLIPLVNLLVKVLYGDRFKYDVIFYLRQLLFCILMFIFALMIVFANEIVDFFWNNLEKSALTGRGFLWLTVIQQLRGDALVGLGPGAFWQAGWASEIAKTTAFKMDPNWIQRMVAADGSYIDLFASLGMVGLVLFLLTAVDLYRRLLKNWGMCDSRLIFVLVTFVLLHGITESTILYSTNILWLIYLLCYFRVAGYGCADLYKVSIDNKRSMICG